MKNFLYFIFVVSVISCNPKVDKKISKIKKNRKPVVINSYKKIKFFINLKSDNPQIVLNSIKKIKKPDKLLISELIVLLNHKDENIRKVVYEKLLKIKEFKLLLKYSAKYNDELIINELISKDDKIDKTISDKPGIINSIKLNDDSFPQLPVLKGNLLYFSTKNKIYCLNSYSFKKLWEYKTLKNFSNYPLIFKENKLIVINPELEKREVIELNRFSGEVLKKYSQDKHSALFLKNIENIDLFVNSKLGFSGFSNGKKVWGIKIEKSDNYKIVKNLILLFSKSSVKIYEVKNGKKLNEFKFENMKFPVILEEYLYLYSKDSFYKIHIKSGKTMWKIKVSMNFEPVILKNKLYIFGKTEKNLINLKDGKTISKTKYEKEIKSLTSKNRVIIIEFIDSLYVWDIIKDLKVVNIKFKGNYAFYNDNFVIYNENSVKVFKKWKKEVEFKITEIKIKGVKFENNIIYFIGEKSFSGFDLSSGKNLGSVKNPYKLSPYCGGLKHGVLYCGQYNYIYSIQVIDYATYKKNIYIKQEKRKDLKIEKVYEIVR
jgi:outer membrane protein assembly factor BamB